jgi:hypothetical protein
MLDALVDVVLVLIFAPSALFAGIYFWTRPWWCTWEGRALLLSSTGWATASGGMLAESWLGVDIHSAAWVVVGACAALSAWMKLALLTLADDD